MTPIYEALNTEYLTESVFVVQGDDGSIASVWPTKEEAEAEMKKMNKEIGGNFFKVEEDPTKDFVKENIDEE